MKHWPFDIIENGKKPKIQVEFKCEKKTFTPEEISSMVSVNKTPDFYNYIWPNFPVLESAHSDSN
jgi:hypothetical protein